MSRVRMVLLAAPVLVLVAVLWTSPAVGSADTFAGGWVATDPGDGSTLKLQIGEAGASGVRRVTLMDQNQFHSGCGGLATGIGSGTVSGTTLSVTLEIRCQGALLATDVAVDFAAVGDTLVGFGLVWERAGD
jgi:hypothetical protein